MALVLITAFDVFTSVGTDNSLERLTERNVGFVTDQRATSMSFLSRCSSNCIAFCIRHAVTYSSGVCPSSSLKRAAKCGARHASRLGQGFDRPGCIHSVVNGTQGSAQLRIENGTKPFFVAFRSRRDVRPEYLDKQNLSQPSRDDSRSGACSAISDSSACIVLWRASVWA
jgi:hypothetical protein